MSQERGFLPISQRRPRKVAACSKISDNKILNVLVKDFEHTVVNESTELPRSLDICNPALDKAIFGA